jgi:hypothetical protein
MVTLRRYHLSLIYYLSSGYIRVSYPTKQEEQITGRFENNKETT